MHKLDSVAHRVEDKSPEHLTHLRDQQRDSMEAIKNQAEKGNTE